MAYHDHGHGVTWCLFLVILILTPGQPEPEPEVNVLERSSNEGSDTELRSYRRPGVLQGGQDGSSNRATIMFPDQAGSITSGNDTVSSQTLSLFEHRKAKGPIPLKLLRRLSYEREVSKIFEKYVTNVKLQDADGQKYLVDLSGRPIEAGLEGKVTIDFDPPLPLEKVGKKKITASFSHSNNKPAVTVLQERVGIPSRVSTPAVCEPELKTVEIPVPNDPNVIQFPKCVRLERCGGCCGSDLLSCEPKRSRQTEVQVQKFAYNDQTEKLDYKETEVIILPSHVECQCNCRVKATDCSSRHVYSSEDCLCICKNRDEQELCHQKTNKLWDPTLCQCVCREIKVCSSGFTFNVDTCECNVNLDRKRLLGSADDEGNTRRNRRAHGRIRFLPQ